MTNREYINTLADEYAKVRYIAELARQHPDYDSLPKYRQRELVKQIMDAEVPFPVTQDLKGQEIEDIGIDR